MCFEFCPGAIKSGHSPYRRAFRLRLGKFLVADVAPGRFIDILITIAGCHVLQQAELATAQVSRIGIVKQQIAEPSYSA